MARPVSEKVQQIKAHLRNDINNRIYRSGDVFPSTRAVAHRYQISYQTAHRLLAELVDEGLLETRHGSGTYVAGSGLLLEGVLLLFHPRARRKQSFGFTLKSLLEKALAREKIPYRTAWTDSAILRYPQLLPVIWEVKPDFKVKSQSDFDSYVLLLNDSRLPGFEPSRVDAISTDNFSGGACAAQLLLRRYGFQEDTRAQRQIVILAANRSDRRCNDRIAGFQSLLPVPESHIVQANSWLKEDGFKFAPEVLNLKPSAVFCCNDRLAEGLIHYCRKKRRTTPRLIGFDNAPIAEKLGLTTIAIPWHEMVTSAIEIIKKRIKGNRSTARRQIFAPHPVYRSSCYPATTNQGAALESRSRTRATKLSNRSQ